MSVEYVEGGQNMNDTNDVVVERRMVAQRRREAVARAEHRRIYAIIRAYENGDDDAFDAPAPE